MHHISPFTVETIGLLQSPYKEKFAVPRQPNLVNAKGRIQLISPYNDFNALDGLDQFSHVWLIFQFHQNLHQSWQAKIRPPRLGGNKKIGVFASRSPFRPNFMGQSVVKLEKVWKDGEKCGIDVSGIDLMDGTPIIDIKPYIPYTDAIPDAQAGFAQQAPEPDLTVEFLPELTSQLNQIETLSPGFMQLVKQVLAQDPRPAYKKDKLDTKDYGVHLYQFNVQWRVCVRHELPYILVFGIQEVPEQEN